MKKITLLLAILFVALACRTENTETDNPATTDGSVTFWTKQDFGCGAINVTINGKTQTITDYYSNGVNACNLSGCANFTLPPGNYPFTASCQNKTWSGNVTVSENSCFKMELTASSNSPGGQTGNLTIWTAVDHGCGNISVTIQNTGSTGTVSSYYSSYINSGAPNCGSSGCANFTLPPGQYTVVANCQNYTWNFTANVTANGCSTIKLT